MVSKKIKKPLYVQIRDKITDMIKKGELRPGDAVLSEHLMADQFGVSRLTVRKAYQVLVEDGILKAIHGKGTFVADKINKESLNSKYVYSVFDDSKDVIGIIFPEITVFFSKILKEIEQLARQEGYVLNIKFNDSLEKEKIAIEELIKKNVKGIIMTPYRFGVEDDYSHFDIMIKEKIPFVMIGKPPFHVRCDSVYVDDELGVFECLEEVVAKGYKKIVHLTDITGDFTAVNERRSGYIKGMKKNGLENNIKIYSCNEDNWEDKIYKDVLNNKIEVILASSDLEAIKLFNASFKYEVRIPEDLKIIGYDDMAFESGVNNIITSIRQPRKRLARKSFDLLREMFEEVNVKNKEDYVKHIVMRSELVKRNTFK